MSDVIRCGECGIRYGGKQRHCPKCGESRPTSILVEEPAAAGMRQGPSTAAALSIVLLCGLVLAAAGGLWAARGSSTAAAIAPAGPSPLARVFQPDAPRRHGSAPVPIDIPVLDAPAAGKNEYHHGNYEAALAHFQAKLQENPGDAESLSNAGQVLVRLGRTPEALPLLSEAAELDPTRWAYRFNLARAEGLLGQWEKAAEDYGIAARLFPGDYATTFNLAQALHRLGREQEAVAQYRLAIEARPDDPTFYLALAVSEETLGRRSEAAVAYRRFVALSPTAPQAQAVAARAKSLESPAAGQQPATKIEGTLAATTAPGGN